MRIDYQPPPQLLDSLSDKQREAAVRLSKENRGLVWWKVGEGKTRIALCWAYYVTGKPRPLVICSPGAFRQWQDEIDLLGLTRELKPRFLSYGMLSRGKPLVIDFEKFNCLIIDELWLYKNFQSKRSRMIYDISHRVPAIGLSGSMVTARNIEDLYGQARALRLDTLFARNITDFRRQFTIEWKNYAGFMERYPTKKAVEQIQTALQEVAHIYFPKETREIRDITANVDPTIEQAKIKHKLVSTYYYDNETKDGFKLEVTSAAAMLVKLQQVSDGFLRDQEGNIVFIKSSKAIRLRELCTELLDAGERILVWVAFRESANQLRKALPFPVVLLSGEHPFDYHAWRKGEAKVCVATVGSGASLNDFKDVRYAIFYSTRFSHLQVQQAKGRTNRKSSDLACRYYYYLQTTGFPDRDVYEMIEQSRSSEEMVISITNRILANTL